jgi:hypothetical protein
MEEFNYSYVHLLVKIVETGGECLCLQKLGNYLRGGIMRNVAVNSLRSKLANEGLLDVW